MKAKISPRINLDGRTALETVIPLSTPFILFVDPSSACNFRCKFCPTGDHELMEKTGRYQGSLDFELYKKIIDDLKDFDKPIKVLRLYKDGEPLLNKKFPDMIHYAKKSNKVEYIDTTTNASLLDCNISMRMLNAGLDKINISINGLSDEQLLEFSRARVSFRRIVDNIRYLYKHKGKCEIVVKICDNGMTEEDKKKFYDTFGDMCDRIFIENPSPCWPEFDVMERTGKKMDVGIYQNKLTDVDTCPYIFYSMSVNSDGTVSLCFLDWERKLLIGDARESKLRDIWMGNTLYAHQLNNLCGFRKVNKTCADCGQLSHCLPDNIDKYRGILLERLTR